jgi:uncharacterized protein YjaG (DUF416 family)
MLKQSRLFQADQVEKIKNNMIFNSNDLSDVFFNLDHNKQVFFGLLCAERLRACCWAFGQKESWDLSIYYVGCDLVFNQLAHNTTIDKMQREKTIEKLEATIPQSDDFGDALSVQAQSGLLALLYTLEGLEIENSEGIIESAGAVVEGLDNYDYFITKILTNNPETHNEFPLLDREIQWQFEILRILNQTTQLETKEFIHLRVLNRNYSVPIAV